MSKETEPVNRLPELSLPKWVFGGWIGGDLGIFCGLCDARTFYTLNSYH